MTKKDYIKLASVISAFPDRLARVQLAMVFGNMLAIDNPRFDWNKWRAACG